MKLPHLFFERAALLGCVALAPLACSDDATDTSNAATTQSGGNNAGGGPGDVARGGGGAQNNPTGTAGNSAGGTAAGGAATGGTATGGAATGGAATGGAATGGAATGGAAAGGNAAGGAAGGNAAGGAGVGGATGRDPADKTMSFFVTSYGIGANGTSGPGIPGEGNLGGLVGADAHCQKLAAAVGSKFTWKAYLSSSAENARDRIGVGPWYNGAGTLVAMNLDGLHTTNGMPGRAGDIAVFGVLESGATVPDRNHDVITGSNEDGTVAMGKTCNDWTSNAATDMTVVGHLDGMGGGRPGTNGWNSEHDSRGCQDGAISTPGNGLFYCFAP